MKSSLWPRSQSTQQNLPSLAVFHDVGVRSMIEHTHTHRSGGKNINKGKSLPHRARKQGKKSSNSNKVQYLTAKRSTLRCSASHHITVHHITCEYIALYYVCLLLLLLLFVLSTITIKTMTIMTVPMTMTTMRRTTMRRTNKQTTNKQTTTNNRQTNKQTNKQKTNKQTNNIL